ncbi:MAG: VTT domain-containing protein [Lachnospiraceae bacterium]|nr:VTT domain-containing protein [Lachnospiraceae bacterium]
MKKKVEKAIILISLVTVLVLFSFFLRDILVPFIRLELDNDLEGARRLLISRGVLGFFTVTLVEALQMVVIFIPAEFIQISSGLSYPFPVAVLLCDLGVCLGATIIFILVRTFRFDNAAYAKNREKIDKFSAAARKEKSVAFLMFFLFLMPLIPFGAICYYGSSTKIRYRDYILTVAIGVIPSIVTSNLMGAAAKAFIRNSIPIPLLVLIIALLAAVLFVLIFLFLDRVWFKENDCTPDSPIYTAFFRFVHLLRGPKQRLHLSGVPEEGFRAPYIMLCNHESFYDFYYVSRLDRHHNPAYVVNKYYLTRPLIRKLTKKAGFIPKKLFNPDMSTVGGIVKTIRGGHPVVIFPEARLSPDGRSNPIIEKGAGLYKKLDADIILVKISGAYYAKPKWRKTFYRSDITVSVERIITAEEAKTIPDEELDRQIEDTLYSAAVMPAGKLYHHRNLAEGLQNVLYRCADCGALYTTRGTGNDLICTACGVKRSFDGQYRFSTVSGNTRMTAAPGAASAGGAPLVTSIADYYDRIRELELKDLDSLDLRAGVSVKIFDEKGALRAREHGTCAMTPEVFTYTPDTGDGFSIDMDRITAIPFSCGEEFELYYKNELYYFYPDTDRIQAARWALAADLLRERRAGTGKDDE